MIEELIDRQVCRWLPKAEQLDWSHLTFKGKRERIVQLIERVVVAAGSVDVQLSDAGRTLLGVSGRDGQIRIDVVMKRGCGGQKLVPREHVVVARPDRALIRAMARAHDLRDRLERGGDIGLRDLACEDKCTRPYVSSMIRLAYLAPDIVEAILQGKQPARLILADLMARDIPNDWAHQRRAFGFL
jgi:hypothetical protein